MILGTIVLGILIMWIASEIGSFWIAMIGFIPLFIATSYASHRVFKSVSKKIRW